MTEKRKRGRPPGDGINDDKPLAMIAEMMITHHCGLWSAVKEISKRPPWGDKAGGPEACQRRWMRKWKIGGMGVKLLAATAEAHCERAVSKPPRVVINPGGKIDPAWVSKMDSRTAYYAAEMARISEPARQRMARIAEQMNTPQMREMRERMAAFANSPAAREMQRMAAEMQAKIQGISGTMQQIYIPEIKPRR